MPQNSSDFRFTNIAMKHFDRKFASSKEIDSPVNRAHAALADTQIDRPMARQVPARTRVLAEAPDPPISGARPTSGAAVAMRSDSCQMANPDNARPTLTTDAGRRLHPTA